MAPKRKRKATAKTSQAPKDPAVTFLAEKGAASNYLQVLPGEIRLMIYSLAVVQDEPIRPVQIEHRSNKFKTASLLPKSRQQAVCTFTSLLLSSRFFYDETLAHPFFYRENEFAFPSVTSLHIFLSALTPARRSSLCQIRLGIISWWGVCLYGEKAVSLAADMLSHCTSLRSLKVDIGITTGILYPTPATWFANRRQSGPTSCMISPNSKPWAALRRIRNLQRFEVSLRCRFCEDSLVAGLISGPVICQSHQFHKDRNNLEQEIQLLHVAFLEIAKDVCTKSAAIPVSGRRLTEVLAASRLDFYGEDRVRQDLQAGMVSSRTRGRMKRLETAGSINGVIPGAKLNPKYLEVDEYQGEEDQ
ncbi:hypothetical protein CCHR01_03350 [Colletotrichum chrysophilum]|uniref:Uncharacterized protein n=1 Tax=Colletotrichum chrysophilum TaxID=1836956 RepID=A0AAD9AV44_9PEZI|nr:hypothetical protein CCHR01_03350 [Colletotrichum chrysophilum]